MGNSQSVFTEDEFEWFCKEENTFFRRPEILRIHHYFQKLSGSLGFLDKDTFTSLPELQMNPFKDRIAQVFGNDDGNLLFEDFLDYLSVFSSEATHDVKSFYAFRIYDFDDDEYLNADDIEKVIRCQVGEELSAREISLVIKNVFEESDIDGDGQLSFIEFDHVLARCPDFSNVFKVRF